MTRKNRKEKINEVLKNGPGEGKDYCMMVQPVPLTPQTLLVQHPCLCESSSMPYTFYLVSSHKKKCYFIDDGHKPVIKQSVAHHA